MRGIILRIFHLTSAKDGFWRRDSRTFIGIFKFVAENKCIKIAVLKTMYEKAHLQAALQNSKYNTENTV